MYGRTDKLMQGNESARVTNKARMLHYIQLKTLHDTVPAIRY